MTHRQVFLALLVVALIIPLGCRDNSIESQIRDVNRNNIQRLANLYGSFQSRNGWVGPQDKEEFLSFVEMQHARKLERMGIDPTRLEELFTSPRDEEALKIRYGVRGGMGACAPVVFEAVGVNGRRWVGFTAMRSEEVAADRYDQLWSGQLDNAAAERTDLGGQRPSSVD